MGSSWGWGGPEDVGEGGIPLIGGSVTVVVGPHTSVRLNTIVCHAREVSSFPDN